MRVVQWLMGQVVTGARTSGVAGMPGTWSSHKAGTPRGRPSRGTAGTNPKTGGHQPKDWQALPFNTVGDHEFFLDFGDCVFEVVISLQLGAWYSRTVRRLVACYVLLVFFPSLVWSVPPLLLSSIFFRSE